MKIEVKTRGSKEYYDEFLYVASQYKRLLKKPRKKVYRLTKYLILYSCLLLLFIFYFTLIYFQHKDIFCVFLAGMLSLLLIYSLVALFKINKQIKTFMSIEEKDKVIEINENGVEYISTEKNLKVKWKDIAYVISNKYSICFLPKQTTNILIGISVDYKQEVLDGLRKYERGLLFIDNNE